MALTFDTDSTSLTHLVEFFKQLETKAATVSKKKKIIFTYSHTKAYVTKFDLGVKWV